MMNFKKKNLNLYPKNKKRNKEKRKQNEQRISEKRTIFKLINKRQIEYC